MPLLGFVRNINRHSTYVSMMIRTLQPKSLPINLCHNKHIGNTRLSIITTHWNLSTHSMSTNRAFAINNYDIAKLPVLQFPGRSVVIDTIASENAFRFSDLVDHNKPNGTVLGFDSESRPCMYGQRRNPTAIVQVASDNLCVIWNLKSLGGLPSNLHRILVDSNIIKVSQGADHEMDRLRTEFSINPSGFVDLHHLALHLRCTPRSLKSLVGIFLQKRLSKEEQLSDWETSCLSQQQIQYAATDAWVCRETLLAMRRFFNVSRLPCERVLGADESRSMSTDLSQQETEARSLREPIYTNTGNLPTFQENTPNSAGVPVVTNATMCPTAPTDVASYKAPPENNDSEGNSGRHTDVRKRAKDILTAICIAKGYVLEVGCLEATARGFRCTFSVTYRNRIIRSRSLRIHGSIRDAQADAAYQALLELANCRDGTKVSS
eukprot:GHVQ01032934.1.p1 GENE.GHVQ01032934.1~~GHVQ01032934.1.p1  ORF type:complete len:435 (-),score=36.02 GHVQ01032934.1:707-2011(-)